MIKEEVRKKVDINQKNNLYFIKKQQATVTFNNSTKPIAAQQQ